MYKNKLILVATSLMAATLWGCGSSSNSGGDQTGAGTTVLDAQNVGSDNCKVCHSSLTHTKLSGIAGINPDPSGLASAITHDCEACHGGGQFHFGVGPIPYPSPSGERCITCHEQQVTKVVASKHNAGEPDNLTMIASGHDTGKCQRCHTAEGSRAFASVIGNKAAYDAIVSYGTVPGPGQFEALNNLDAGGNQILHNPTCGACHNALSKELVTVAGWDPNNNGVSDQFDLCTSCHVYNLNNNGTLIGSGGTYTVSTGAGVDGIWFTADDVLSAGTPTEAFYHDTSWYRTIASTHYDNPASEDVIEGYIIRKNSPTPCFDCHGHELNTNTRYANTTDSTKDATSTIHTDWAQSGHAGGLLKAKYDVARTAGINKSGTTALTNAVMGVGVTPDSGPAWADEGGVDAGSSCARCHTATGAASYLDNPAAYDSNTLDFSHREVGQKEMLYCWGCHSNAAAGVLRNPGAITLDYANSAQVVYADVQASNGCITCHSGREVGDEFKNPALDFANLSEIRPHYLAAAGIVFAKSGYTFTGRDYSIPAGDLHVLIGTGTTGNANVDTYTNGPCVACHFDSNDGSHTLSPFTEYAPGDVALNPVCVSCHSTRGAGSNAEVAWYGTAATAATLQGTTHNARYQAALEALKVQLAAKGFNYYDGRHYTIPIVNPATDAVSGNRVTNWGNAGNAGAAFNYNLLIHEPGGVAHNRRYTRRLMYDAIDWLDNGALDFSVAATLNALDDATTYKASAISYLLKASNGDAGDRH
jgi:hypothetical protein